MNNTPQPPANEPPKKLRVERVHGGESVEEIETVTLMNQPECAHPEWKLDPSETDFIAYMCTNDKCAIVKLFDK